MVNPGKREDGLLDELLSRNRRIRSAMNTLDYWRREYPDLAPVFDDIERALSLDPAIAD